MRYCYGDSVMIHSGKYTSYIAEFCEYSKCEKYATVNVDLSPEPVVRKIRLLASNLTPYSEGEQ